MTQKQTKEAIRVMQAYVDGKEVECKHLDAWARIDQPSWNWVYCDYRIKPTATLRPWTADEVPLGAFMRPKQGSWRTVISTVDPDGRIIVHYGVFSCEFALQNHEHSLDGGKTWLPCGVVEEAK